MRSKRRVPHRGPAFTYFRLWLLTAALLVALIGGNASPAATGASKHAPNRSAGPKSTPVRRAVTTPQVRSGGTVVIDSVAGSLWSCGFSPFLSATNSLSQGVLYEPLFYVNTLTGKETPWLATSYNWSDGNKVLTFVIRKGVRWSDGRPFTAADVVFTFNLLKRFPTLDLLAVWSVLSVVRQQSNQVMMTFKRPSVPYFYFIADQNSIVAQHIWSKIKNPVTFADRHPVGTGPFEMSQCSPRVITYTRNPHYWMSGRPHVARVVYPAFKDNQPGNIYLAQGKANWGCQYIPNVETAYVKRDPAHRHFWYPPGSDVDLYLNQTVYPLTLRPVRQALSYAIDRARISRLGVYGYLPPANQSGIVLPTFTSWYDRGLAAKYAYRYNPRRALALLNQAGFKRGPHGMLRSRSGKPLSFSLISVGSFSDWVAEVSLIKSNLQQLGIIVNVENLASSVYSGRMQAGRFQLAYGSTEGGPNPYYELNSVLHSANTAPIGQTASSNYERWKDKTTDTLLDAFATTTNAALQHAAISQIQGIMLQDVPVIPVLEGVTWYQYDTSQLVGWPSASNPYANPGPCATPDWEVVLLNLHLK